MHKPSFYSLACDVCLSSRAAAQESLCRWMSMNGIPGTNKSPLLTIQPPTIFEDVVRGSGRVDLQGISVTWSGSLPPGTLSPFLASLH